MITYILVPKKEYQSFEYDVIATNDIDIIKQHIINDYEKFTEINLYFDGNWNMYWEFNTGKRMTRRADYCESKEELLEIIDAIKIK